MSAQKRAPEKRLRAFRGNSFDDYFDTGMRNFPLPARVFLGIAVYACLVWTQFRWRWSVENKEKLVDDKTPRVIVMNHGSMLDPVIIIVREASVGSFGGQCLQLHHLRGARRH